MNTAKTHTHTNERASERKIENFSLKNFEHCCCNDNDDDDAMIFVCEFVAC